MQSKIKIPIIILALLAIGGCSNSNSTGPDDQLFVEYDDGLNMTVELKDSGSTGSEAIYKTAFQFYMPQDGIWTLSILNSTGYGVRHYGGYGGGSIYVEWDWTNMEGMEVKDGIYICEIQAAGLGARRALWIER